MKRVKKEIKFSGDFKSTKFTNLFLEKINIKIICLILAIAMYIFIGYIQRADKVFSCKLKITGLNDSFVITNNIPEIIKVTVKDKQYVLDRISEEDFNVRLDLSEISETNKYQLKLKWNIPKTSQSFLNSIFFSSIEMNPDKIDVYVEKLLEKNVPIIINSIGTISKGYSVKKRTLDNYYVRIQGPERIINDIKFIETEKIDIENEIESFKRYVNLVSPSPLVTIIGKNSVEATLEITRLIEPIRLNFTEVEINNLRANLKSSFMSDIYISVSLTGDKDDLSRVTKDNVILSIDCSRINYPGEYSMRVEVSVPKNIILNSIKPDIVKIKIDPKI